MKAPAIILLVITLLLPACTQAAPSPAAQTVEGKILAAVRDTATAEAVIANRITATSTAAPTATRTRVPTRRPSPTGTPVPQPTATLPYPVLSITTEIAPLGAPGMANLHGVILFKSSGYTSYPFNFSEMERLRDVHGDVDPYKGALSRFCDQFGKYKCLWALSPDGQSGGLLSAQVFDFDWYLPPDSPRQIVENGFVTNHPAFQPVRLPAACSQDPNSSLEQRCDSIRFSEDGRFLAFRYGPDACAKRAMQVIDRQTGEAILNIKGGVDGIEPLQYGKLMIRVGHCQGMGLTFFDPLTRKETGGGGDGQTVWNQTRSVLVVGESSGMSYSMGIWGYNLKTGQAFHPEGQPGYSRQSWPADEHVIMLPDDRRILYQHLRIKAEGTYPQQIPVIDTPAQIVRYDLTTGQRTVLASDPAYHYRLCQFDYPTPCPMQWYGDWVQVQRVPFTPLRPDGYEWSIATVLPCFADGKDCAAPPEAFALNANTGELRPWDPASLPLASPTPTPTPGPTLSDQPLYSDPAGRYALYTSADGTSLWMQPRQGPAVKWIGDAEGFFYLP